MQSIGWGSLPGGIARGRLTGRLAREARPLPRCTHLFSPRDSLPFVLRVHADLLVAATGRFRKHVITPPTYRLKDEFREGGQVGSLRQSRGRRQ